MGPDDIPVNLLKKCSDNFAKPLVHVINLSFQTGKFPEALKSTTIRPIYKKGNKSDFANYRPIALESVFSKVMEKIV